MFSSYLEDKVNMHLKVKHLTQPLIASKMDTLTTNYYHSNLESSWNGSLKYSKANVKKVYKDYRKYHVYKTNIFNLLIGKEHTQRTDTNIHLSFAVGLVFHEWIFEKLQAVYFSIRQTGIQVMKRKIIKI